ncbi:MAG: LLM class flavin-dependent oxidoreductase, partial [Acidimicrobiales bacterium]|nr:LLM class flavin-dependent oxidoreductase [Acidimicrobiales bacterium]
MNIGIFAASTRRLDRVIEQARAAAEDGFSSFWLPQVAGLDALTAIALAGREVAGIGFGTAVVPIQPRHPQVLASQALTVQAAIGGRLALGVGLSHQFVVEHLWGLPWDRPVRRMRDYLDALLPLLSGELVEIRSGTVTCVGSVRVADVEAPTVLLAALGPRMLRLAGERAAGTVTWCT